MKIATDSVRDVDLENLKQELFGYYEHRHLNMLTV